MAADFYELLGVAPTAPAAEIRQAYLKLARDLHPDRFPDPARKAEAQTRFTAVSEAFNTLFNDRTRREYDAVRGRPAARPPEETARESWERGQQALAQRQYHDAVELFRTADRLHPDQPAYLAALAQALARNPHWVREALQTLERALQLAPKEAVLHAELAGLLVGQGLKLRARRSAETARRLAPGHPEVERLLAGLALEEDPPPSSPGEGGGLRGLLRRKP